MIKAYKMNGIDIVVAETEEEAKTYYAKEVGQTKEEVEHDFVGEVSLNTRMWINIDDLPLEEQKQCLLMKKMNGGLFVERSFKWVLENEKPHTPCIISSTEY